MKNHKNISYIFQKKPAFTLIELVVAIFIASLLLAVFSSVLSFSFKNLEHSVIDNELKEEANYTMNYLISQIESADKLYKTDDFVIKNNFTSDLGLILKKDIDNQVEYIIFTCEGKRLARRTCKIDKDKDIKEKNSLDFNSMNSISNILLDKSLNIDEKKGLIKLELTFKKMEKTFTVKTNIFKFGRP